MVRSVEAAVAVVPHCEYSECFRVIDNSADVDI